ncbi:hypothetical protein [Defluviitalea phaphyphila]|uniref:hypothetical protein n=1 Tax=Defluviitalea phaphyphila TaxID=1473580 RepID=UPI000731B034|nr:hypothetical protein [Defluviitalea phaphyphila]
MGRTLLSIDWDFFIYTKKENWGSYIENNETTIKLWYKRYILSKAQGINIQNFFKLSSEINTFWEKLKKYFLFTKDTKVYVSDSHVLSYDIAINNGCNIVYLFDAHSDLGYGGLSSLNFEVNCANWLGKLLKNKKISQAHIIYSPYTIEKPEYFREINNAFNIHYLSLSQLDKDIKVYAIHICRSGAWTPPWFDEKFMKFVSDLGIPFKIIDCPVRKWNTENMTFSDQIDYLLA